MRKNIFLVVLLTIILNVHLFSGEEPKIGLVLSGGGAKGFIHIGVLKVLEEEKIPIDYISGTSMGSIVASLYSVGYTAKELEELVTETNWFYFFDDSVERKKLPMEEKGLDGRYIVSLPLEEWDIKPPKGLINGHKVELFLRELLWDARDINSFSNLPIPFACVTTDIETGESVTINSGDLVNSVRASMAIPSAFTPVEIDGRLLVDGMLAKNFPVEDVIDLGADVVIGVDVGTGLMGAEKLDSFFGIIQQSFNFKGAESTNMQRQLCDLLIEPEQTTLTPFSYGEAKELIAIGERAARKKIAEIREYSNAKKFNNRKKIKDSTDKGIFINDLSVEGLTLFSKNNLKRIIDWSFPAFVDAKEIEKAIDKIYSLNYFSKVNYRIEGDKIKFVFKEKTQDSLKLGFRYDSETKAALLLNLTRRSPFNYGSKAVFDLRLGDSPYFTWNHYFLDSTRGNFGLIFDMDISEKSIDIYDGEKRIANVEYNDVGIGATMATLFSNKNFFGFGLRQEFIDIEPTIAPIEWSGYDKNLLVYQFVFGRDSLDRSDFPEEGSSFAGVITYAHDDLASNADFKKYSFNGKKVMKLSEYNNLELSLGVSSVEGKEIPESYYAFLGGQDDFGNVAISFPGLNTMEIVTNNAIAVQVTERYEMQKDRFVFAELAIASTAGEFDRLTTDDNFILGGSFGFGAMTYIGPIELKLMKAESRDILGYVNVGYRF